jgi:hypothetical protein
MLFSLLTSKSLRRPESLVSPNPRKAIMPSVAARSSMAMTASRHHSTRSGAIESSTGARVAAVAELEKATWPRTSVAGWPTVRPVSG